MSGSEEKRYERIDISEASIQWEITEVWWYANKVWGSLRWVHSSNMKAIWWVVAEKGRESIDQSEASIRWKIAQVWWYAIAICIPPRRSCIASMKSMGLIVLEKTSKNQSTNQRPVFGGKSLEHNDMRLTPVSHLGGHVYQVWSRWG